MRSARKGVYFAGESREYIGSCLKERVDSIVKRLSTSGYYDLLERSYQAYYGIDETGTFHASSQLTEDGRQGQYTRIKINELRNLIQHVLVMTTSQRLVYEPKATNTSPEFLEQTTLAAGILEYYLRTKKIEHTLTRACEAALVFGEGFATLEWDPNAGSIHSLDPDTERPVYTGDVVCEHVLYSDVFRDPDADNNNWDWIIVRKWKNRYDLAALFPSDADKIYELPDKRTTLLQQQTVHSGVETQEAEKVAVYYFYHRRSPALPNGRHVVFCNDELVLLDVDLPYSTLPVYRVAAGEMFRTPFGYTAAFDGLAIQQALDILHSIILSNEAATGVQLIWMPEGANIEYRQLSEGLTVVQTPPGHKPEPIQLTHSPPEIFTFLPMLGKKLETLFGVSSVNRGSPEASLKSGSALALVQAMSIQFNSGFQKSVVSFQEDIGTGIIQILKTYASLPQIAMLVGRNEQSYLKSFTGEDLQGIDGVVVNVGSPLSQTTAGRVEMARDMLANGLIKNPDQYIQVANSGRLDPIIEGTRGKLLLIKRENDELLQGQVPPVMPTDNHPSHIIEHGDALNTPEARRDPKIRDAVIQHLQDHINQWTDLSNSNPNLLMALGIQPITPAAPEEMAPQAPQGKGGTPAAPTAEVMGEPSSAMPAMPRSPTNPATGDQVDIQIPQGA